jgi:hypothetical protein
VVRPEPTSGRELTNRLVEYRIQQKTELDKIQTEVRRSRNEVFILCGVVTVTFRVLSLLQ